jgi:hypothetical protein
MNGLLFYGGLTAAVAGAGLPLILPSLPGSIQSGPLAPVGSFLIGYQNWIVLAGILLVLLSILI